MWRMTWRALSISPYNEAFWKFSAALFAGQKAFFDANTYEKSRTQIYAELAQLAAATAGVNEAEVLGKLAMVVEVGPDRQCPPRHHTHF